MDLIRAYACGLLPEELNMSRFDSLAPIRKEFIDNIKSVNSNEIFMDAYSEAWTLRDLCTRLLKIYEQQQGQK